MRDSTAQHDGDRSSLRSRIGSLLRIRYRRHLLAVELAVTTLAVTATALASASAGGPEWPLSSSEAVAREAEPAAQGDPARAHTEASSLEEYLMTAYGLTADEADDRLRTQFEAQLLSDQLIVAWPQYYSGMWLEQAEGTLTIAVVPGAPSLFEEAIALSPVADSVVLTQADSSLRELEATADRLRADRGRLADMLGRTEVGFGVSVQSNVVEVYTSSFTAQQSRIVADYFGDDVRLVEGELKTADDGGDSCSRSACEPPLRGGILKRNDRTGGNSTFCCNMRSTVTGDWYIASHGHATSVGDEMSHNGRKVGYASGVTDNGRIDSARIRIFDNQRSFWDDYFGNPSRWFFGSTGAQQFRYVNRNPPGVVIGAAICRSGTTTGARCGQILQADANPFGSNNDYLLLTSACAAPGDSGGPYYTQNDGSGYRAGTIFGLHVTSQDAFCGGDDRSYAAHIYFQEQHHRLEVVVS